MSTSSQVPATSIFNLLSKRSCRDLGLCQNLSEPCPAEEPCARQLAEAAVQTARLRSEPQHLPKINIAAFAPGTIDYGPSGLASFMRWPLWQRIVVAVMLIINLPLWSFVLGYSLRYSARILGWI